MKEIVKVGNLENSVMQLVVVCMRMMPALESAAIGLVQ